MAVTDNVLGALGATGQGQGLKRSIDAPPSNSLIGGGAGMDPKLKALLEKLKRQSAFQGMDGIMSLLALLDGGIGGGGGGNNGGGNTGGGGFCLRFDTPVSMADGTFKRAEDIKPGDLILGIDSGIGIVPQEVFTVTIANQKCFRVIFDGGEIYASATHNWFMSDGDQLEIVSTKGLVPGMLLIKQDGSFAKVDSISEDDIATVYWWNCSPNQCYYAGGVLHHNADGGLQQVIRDDPVTGGLGQGMGKEELGFTIGVGGS